MWVVGAGGRCGWGKADVNPLGATAGRMTPLSHSFRVLPKL